MGKGQNLLEQGGKEIAKLLDDGKPNDALARLYHDYSEMLSHRDGFSRFKGLLTLIEVSDKKGCGWDLEITGTSKNASVSMIKPEHSFAGSVRSCVHAAFPELEICFGAKNEKALFKVKDDLVVPYSGSWEVDADNGDNFLTLGAGFAESSALRRSERIDARLRNLAKSQLTELLHRDKLKDAAHKLCVPTEHSEVSQKKNDS